MARWIISVELANKTTAVMASLSKLAAEAALEQGVEIDMGALIKKPKVKDAGKKGGSKKAAAGVQLSSKEAAQKRKEAKIAAQDARKERGAALKAAADEARASAAAALSSDAGHADDATMSGAGNPGETAVAPGAVPASSSSVHASTGEPDGTGGSAEFAAGCVGPNEAPSGEAPGPPPPETGKRKRSMIQRNPLAKWEAKAAKMAKRVQAREAKQHHKVDVRRQLMAVLKGKQRAAADSVGVVLLPPVVSAVALVPQFDDADPASNAAADVIAAALALPLPAMDSSTFRFAMGEGAPVPSAEVGVPRGVSFVRAFTVSRCVSPPPNFIRAGARARFCHASGSGLVCRHECQAPRATF